MTGSLNIDARISIALDSLRIPSFCSEENSEENGNAEDDE